MTEDLLATKIDDQRFKFLTGKIWLWSVVNWEDSSLWYLPQIQGVYTEAFKGTEFKNGIYFVLRPLLHRFLSDFCFRKTQASK